MKLMNILVGIMLSSVFTICLSSKQIEISGAGIFGIPGGQCKSKTTGKISPMTAGGLCPAGTEMVDKAGNPFQMLG
jgi:hypothetical protein